MRRLIIVALVMLLGGCANKLYISYLSDPPGATVYSGAQNYGPAPVRVWYEVSDADRANGFKILQGVKMRWVSGAEAEVASLRADLSLGTEQHYTLPRPAAFAGADIDARYAVEIQRSRAAAEAASDEQTRAALATTFNAISAYNYGRAAATPQLTPAPRLDVKCINDMQARGYTWGLIQQKCSY